MTIARVFKSGNSQAVRLPNDFRFKGREVKIFRRGNEIVLQEELSPMVRAFELLADLPYDVFPKSQAIQKIVLALQKLVSSQQSAFSWTLRAAEQFLRCRSG
jgi:antitoxin VapB